MDILLDSFLDCLKLLPFLFLSYLLVEYVEHRMSSRSKDWLRRAGKAGPLLGSLIGLIPQCGFSAAVAGLFSGGVASPGTLLAVFLSTSDEMLPIMISEGAALSEMLRILAVKAVIAALAGLLVDALAGVLRLRRERMEAHLRMCSEDHCGCEEHGIVRSALHHTVQVAVFIFLVSLLIGFAVEGVGAQRLSAFFSGLRGGSFLSALFGLIPNCAASVMITELYLEGVLGYSAMIAGLLCGAGAGLLVLFRENHNLRENLTLTGLLYVISAAAGLALEVLGF